VAVIHKTTMSPGKLELLAAWLPAQPWYVAARGKPELARAGGFRLDDPAGQVGIEFMAVTGRSGGQAITYLVPMTYRGQALASASRGLIGTSYHGVLGRRWIYDGLCDPVLVTQLVALIQGEAEPQMQTVSNTPDPSVTGQPVTNGSLTVIEPAVTVNGPSGSDLRVQTTGSGTSDGRLIIHVNRILQPGVAPDGQPGQPCLYGAWRQPDGNPVRGILATSEYMP
jgi:maltokinase-like protein